MTKETRPDDHTSSHTLEFPDPAPLVIMRQTMALECIDEGFKGNVRFRVYRHEITGGNAFAIEASAYNDWAGQSKLLFFGGGMDRRSAMELFKDYVGHVRGYDWQQDDFLPE